MNDKIIIKGAKEHNLKNINLEIPRDKLVVITGLSGSGKSSLAFDTLYAEGQRRYVESLSSYARQFLGIMQKPDVESIDGLSPAISIDQKTTSKNPRSTVGTVTEIYDYIRLLYARIGVPYCPNCGKKIEKQTIDQIVESVLSLEEGTKLQVLSPVVRGRKGEFVKMLEGFTKEGFVRARVDGETVELTDDLDLDRKKKHNVEIIVDRLVVKEDIRSRLAESVEVALKHANGLVIINTREDGDKLYSTNYACPDCDISFEELTPRMFSFNNPFGACPTCAGIGYLMKMDEDLIIPDKDKTLYDGVKAFGASTMKKSETMAKMYFESIAKHYGVDINVPIKKLPRSFLEKILYGTGTEAIDFEHTSYAGTRKFKAPFEGVIPTLERRHSETKSQGMRDFYEYYMSNSDCPDCKGTRLKKESLAVKVGDKNINELSEMSINKIKEHINSLKLTRQEEIISDQIIKELNSDYFMIIDDKFVNAPNKEWIQDLVGIAQNGDVGIVGTKLYNKDKLVEHCGIIAGMNGAGDLLYKGAPKDIGTYMQRLKIIHNVSAVYYRYALIDIKAFKEAGLLNDNYTGLLTSIDLGLKLLKNNKHVVINPLVEFEVKELREGYKNQEQEIKFKEEWKEELEQGDKFFSPNLSKTNPGLSINI